jgi:predicted RNase H-like HicB family nuclease
MLQQRAQHRGGEANMREAVTQHVTALLDHGDPVPQNGRLVHVEEMAIGIP